MAQPRQSAAGAGRSKVLLPPATAHCTLHAVAAGCDRPLGASAPGLGAQPASDAASAWSSISGARCDGSSLCCFTHRLWCATRKAATSCTYNSHWRASSVTWNGVWQGGALQCCINGPPGVDPSPWWGHGAHPTPPHPTHPTAGPLMRRWRRTWHASRPMQRPPVGATAMRTPADRLRPAGRTHGRDARTHPAQSTACCRGRLVHTAALRPAHCRALLQKRTSARRANPRRTPRRLQERMWRWGCMRMLMAPGEQPASGMRHHPPRHTPSSSGQSNLTCRD